MNKNVIKSFIALNFYILTRTMIERCWRFFMTNKNLAILGFVLALVLGGVPGLIVSAVALKKMKDSGDEDGKGLAIAGLVIGIVETAIIVLTLACTGCAVGCSLCAAASNG